MANIIGGLAGAGGGFATGGPVGAALGGLAGLFGGGGQRMSAAQQAAINQQRQIANQLYNYGTSQPLANQEDLQNLAQSLGILGQQQRSQLGSLAAFGNPSLPTGGTADMLANLQQQGATQRMNITEQHMADAIAARRQALLQAAQANTGAFDMASAPGAVQANPLGGQLAALAQAYAAQQAQKKASDQSEGSQPFPAGGVFTPPPGTTPGQGGIIPALAGPQLSPYAGSTFDPSLGAGQPNLSSLPGYLQSTPEAQGQAQPFEYQFPAAAGISPGYSGVTGGAGDAPAAPPHDPLAHAMQILHLIIKHHLANSKPKPKKKKPKGAGDAPSMPLPGYTAMGMASPQTPMGMQRPAGPQGSQAPGNEPGGPNSVANQIRQPQSAMLDRLRMPSGMIFPY